MNESTGTLERRLIDGTLHLEGTNHVVYGTNSNGVDVTLGELSSPTYVVALLAYLDRFPNPNDWTVNIVITDPDELMVY